MNGPMKKVIPAAFEPSGSNPQTSDDVLVRVETVSKKFCRDLKRSLWYGMKDLSGELLCRRRDDDVELRKDEFWALKDVSFELRRGECLGLIGRNGAGKTTLLRMLNGLIKPDKGRIEMRGRVSALIALGAGFNPILTGRENIYVNGSILGMSRVEIAKRFDEIVEFSEIGEFIDAPVQTYSSGMTVKLGFAVAAVLIQPDVLLIDEVLAVGDMGFKIKSLNTMRQLARTCAVIFVSHSMQFISAFCNRVIVMEKSRVLVNTHALGEGIDSYFSLFPTDKSVAGTGEAKIVSVSLKNMETGETGNQAFNIMQNASLAMEIEVLTKKPGRICIQINVDSGTPVFATRVLDKNGNDLLIAPGLHRITFNYGKTELNAGQYTVVIGVIDPASNIALCRHQGAASFRVMANNVVWGYFVRNVVGTSELLRK